MLAGLCPLLCKSRLLCALQTNFFAPLLIKNSQADFKAELRQWENGGCNRCHSWVICDALCNWGLWENPAYRCSLMEVYRTLQSPLCPASLDIHWGCKDQEFTLLIKEIVMSPCNPSQLSLMSAATRDKKYCKHSKAWEITAPGALFIFRTCQKVIYNATREKERLPLVIIRFFAQIKAAFENLIVGLFFFLFSI